VIILRITQRLFGGNDNLKQKLASAANKIESHKREIAMLRLRLEHRRQSLFEQVVQAIEARDDSRSSVFAVELSEIKKVLRVVKVSELALTQIIVRIQSIKDVGDVYVNMNESFKIMKSISKSISGVVPALENATDEVNNSLSETLAGLGNLSPTISLDLKHESEQDIFEKAKLFTEEKTMELNDDIPRSIASANGDSVFEKIERVALLATDDGSSEPVFKPVLLSKSNKTAAAEDKVFNYIDRRSGHLNILDAAVALNLPADEVEKTVIKLVSEGKIKLGNIEE
jgi:division protein CdvB (Snf7/Vps24/ESCRT-III family)